MVAMIVGVARLDLIIELYTKVNIRHLQTMQTWAISIVSESSN